MTTEATSPHRATSCFDPIVSLRIPLSSDSTTADHQQQSAVPQSAVPCKKNHATALSFLALGGDGSPSCNSPDIDDNDDESIEFECDRLWQQQTTETSTVLTTSATPQATTTNYVFNASHFEGTFLGTGHADGTCLLWDIGKRSIVRNLTVSSSLSTAPVLALQRTDHSRFVLHRRNGHVGLYDIESGSPVSCLQLSAQQTFCQACPCQGNPHLIALPEGRDGVVVRDWRVPSTSSSTCLEWNSGGDHRHGMVTSMAFVQHATTTDPPVLAVGMESGTLAVVNCQQANGTTTLLEMGKEPLLSVDMSLSRTTNDGNPATCWDVIAGMAGNQEDLADKQASEQGRVVMAEIQQQQQQHPSFGLSSRIHARISTTANINNNQALHYKSNRAGVAVCRFQQHSSSSLFAVGGWDHRVRVYDRNTLQPRAILRGHHESITTVDWADDDDKSGLCATGAADGQVLIWQCSSLLS